VTPEISGKVAPRPSQNIGIMEYWNDGVHGYITVIEVRGPSACGGLEA